MTGGSTGRDTRGELAETRSVCTLVVVVVDLSYVRPVSVSLSFPRRSPRRWPSHIKAPGVGWKKIGRDVDDVGSPFHSPAFPRPSFPPEDLSVPFYQCIYINTVPCTRRGDSSGTVVPRPPFGRSRRRSHRFRELGTPEQDQKGSCFSSSMFSLPLSVFIQP